MESENFTRLFSFYNKFSALVFICAFLIFNSNSIFAQQNGYRIRTVVIDAGHGGKDPGAIGKFSYEKNIVLSIALKLGKYIEQNLPDVKVLYTRKSDKFIPLDQRSEIANKQDADLFLSIHVNANRNKKIFGTETYTLGLHKTQENLEVAMKENAVMLYEEDYSTKYEGFNPNNPASYIIFNLLQGVTREKSIKLAELTEVQFSSRAGRHSRGVREAGFWILKQVSMPSILIETGFISNSKEEKFLNTKTGQEYIASAIFRAFRDYKKQVESSSTLIAANSDESNALLTDNTQMKPAISNINTIEYCVQVRSSKNKIPLTAPIFSGLGKVSERKIDGFYKYTVGSSADYNQIRKMQEETRKKIKDCFIVAFLNGERISLSQAKKFKNKIQ